MAVASSHFLSIRGSVPGPGGSAGLGGGLFPVPTDWGPCPGTVGRRAGPPDSGGAGVLGLVWPLQLLPPLERLKDPEEKWRT